VLEEVAELKRSMAENTGLKELREQFARLTSSVKGKTLKITPDVLGLPVKPVCGNCSKNAGGPNDHACHMSIVWSTVYNPTLTRTMSSDANGIAREDGSGPYEQSQNLIIINLSPGDKVIVQTATFICNKQFIHKGCPLADLHCGKYYNDVKNFVQEAFDRLCSEVTQPLEPQSVVNMDEYMAKYTEWVKAGIAHAAREGCNGAITMSHHIRDFTSLPPKMEPIQGKSLNNVLENIPQKKEYRLVNKHTTHSLISGKSLDMQQRESGFSWVGMNPHKGVFLDNKDIWTLEPVD
jgi:hypothetical protein